MKFQFKNVVIFALCLSVTIFSTATFAQEGKIVKVGWYETPFNFTDKFDRRAGYAYDYQQKIAAYTGWKYDYVYGTWPELYEKLRNGELDLMSDISYTPERANLMLFSSLPMGSENYYLFISAFNKEISVSNLASLNGKKIGVNKNSLQAGLLREWAASNGISPQIVEMTESEKISMKMLINGEIDAYVTLDVYEDEENNDAVAIIKIGRSDFFFAVNKNRPDLHSELNAAMSKINDENRFLSNQLYEKYLKTSGTNAFIANDELNWLSQHGTIKVGYLDNYLPFCTSTMTGEVDGMLKVYLELAANCTKNATFNFETKSYPTLKDAFDALKSGEIDCVFPVNLSYYDAEKMDVIVTTPFAETEMSAVIRKTNQHPISPERTMNVAINETDSNFQTFLHDNFPNAHTFNCNSVEECLNAIESDLATCAFVSNYRLAQFNLNKYNLYAISTGTTMNFAFAVRSSDNELYYILNKTANLVPAALVHSALTTYSNAGLKFSFIDFLMSHIELVILAIIALAISVIMFVRRNAKRKEQQLKEKLAIQNQKLEAEQKVREVDSMISSIAVDYRSIYHYDLVRNEGTCYRATTVSDNNTGDIRGIRRVDKFPFREKFTEYANEYVAEEYREGFLKFIEPDNIREKLANEVMTGYRYLTIRNGEEHYEMLRVVDIHLIQNRGGHTINAVSIGFAEVDSETIALLKQTHAAI